MHPIPVRSRKTPREGTPGDPVYLLPILPRLWAGHILMGTSAALPSLLETPSVPSVFFWALPLGQKKFQVPQRPDNQMGLWMGTSELRSLPGAFSPLCPWAGGQLNPGSLRRSSVCSWASVPQVA